MRWGVCRAATVWIPTSLTNLSLGAGVQRAGHSLIWDQVHGNHFHLSRDFSGKDSMCVNHTDHALISLVGVKGQYQARTGFCQQQGVDKNALTVAILCLLSGTWSFPPYFMLFLPGVFSYTLKLWHLGDMADACLHPILNCPSSSPYPSPILPSC